MARVKFINIVVLISILCGCAQLGPFVDRRREAGGLAEGGLYVGESTPQEPAICYNRLLTDFTEVQTLADDECKKHKTGTKATPIKQTIFTCRLLVPNHFYFKCEK